MRFLEHVLSYLKGLFFAYILNIVVIGLGYVQTGPDPLMKLCIAPVTAALLQWTILYFLGEILLIVGSVITAMTAGLGIFIVFFIVGYLALRITGTVLPADWYKFPEQSNILSVCFGVSYAIIGMTHPVSLPKRRRRDVVIIVQDRRNN